MADASFFNQHFGIQWRKALVSIPRLVPDTVLRFTSPEGPHPLLIRITSREKHHISLYVFIPPQVKSKRGDRQAKLPVMIDFHGGGFVLGSCQEQTPWCAQMARELNALVISVDYRLGPATSSGQLLRMERMSRTPSFIPRIQAVHSIRHLSYCILGIQQWLEPCAKSCAVHTSAHVGEAWSSVLPTDFPTTIPFLLFYPSLDCRLLPSERPLAPGMEKKQCFLETLRLESELQPSYLPRDQTSHPRASPGLASLKNGGLHAQARLMLVLPELDTLSAQSAVWIEKVAAEGISSCLSVHKIPGVMHGWTQFPDFWLSEEHRNLKIAVFDEARDFVKRAWEHAEAPPEAPM